MKKNNLPSYNLYLDDETKTILQDIAKKENRSPSKQVKHMLEFYIKHKKE